MFNLPGKYVFFLHPPTGLTIDYFNQRLYWADPELSQIGSMRLDGSDPLVTVSDRHGKAEKKKHLFLSKKLFLLHFGFFIFRNQIYGDNTTCV